MVDQKRCACCGKALPVLHRAGDSKEIVLLCDCSEAQSTQELILAELKAIRALLEGGTDHRVQKDMLAQIHEGEAIVPRICPEPIGIDAVGQPISPRTISCRHERDEVVIRIPDGSARVLVAVEGPADMWIGGWLIENGSTDGSPRELLNRLSVSSASPAPASVGPRQSQACAPAPETPKSGCPCGKAPCPLSQGAQGLASRNADA